MQTPFSIRLPLRYTTIIRAPLLNSHTPFSQNNTTLRKSGTHSRKGIPLSMWNTTLRQLPKTSARYYKRKSFPLLNTVNTFQYFERLIAVSQSLIQSGKCKPCFRMTRCERNDPRISLRRFLFFAQR